jgi:putative transposase
MRKSLFTEPQVIGILKRAFAGQPVAELCRELGITQQTFYRWRRKFGGMEVSDAQELNRLLDENRRLKHLVAELSLDNRILKDVLGKK